MKRRVTLSLAGPTVEYLTRRAGTEAGGNLSALVDRLVRDHALLESVQSHAAWYAEHPDDVDTAEAERYAAGAA